MKYLVATLDWTAGFTMFVGVFATIDGNTGRALALLAAGYATTLLARALETTIDA